MPKLPTVERFKLSCEVEAANLGPTLAQLTKMGLTNLGFELVTDVRRFNKNIKPDVPVIGTSELLAAWFKDHPTFKAIEAVKHLEANGHTRGSAYPALRDIVDKGILKKLEAGHYSRADVKHLTGPKKAKKAKPAKQTRRQLRPRQTFDKRGEDVILSYAKRNHGRFNTAKLIEVFLKEGRAKNSVYASIDALLKAKSVKRVGENGSGQYVLLTKRAKTPKPKSPAPPKPNGGMMSAALAEEAGVADHG